MTKANPFVTALLAAHPGQLIFNRQSVVKFSDENGYPRKVCDSAIKASDRVKWGVYNFSKFAKLSTSVMPTASSEPVRAVAELSQVTPIRPELKAPEPKPAKVRAISNEDVYIPEKAETFVKWGFFSDVKTIIESRMFYPVYITGLSGNGKTMMVEQACAEAKREYIRIQITPETDEDDLIGGFRLLNGETVFAKGPVIRAMEAGAILLVDEIDRGSNKLMAMQGVLEGKPVLIKKTGEVITPKRGFNVIATSNTKGQGSEDGRFIAATIIDEAFLERFTITLEQPYPTEAVERKIVLKHMEHFNCVDSEFAELLTKWSTAIRKTHEDGGIDELISTRRLCHIVQTFAMFNNRAKAVELCVSRFDTDTRTAFVDLYRKIDATATTTADTDRGGVDYRNDSPF